jgi:transglutaminase-like putative cysteine protease
VLGVWLDLHRDGRQTLAAQLQMESMMAQVDEDVSRYLVPTPFIDCDSQQIVEYAHSVTRRTDSPVDNAISLYNAVRDDVRYDPYHLRLDLAHLKASYTLQVRRGYCVAKAVLLAAVSRAVGIPSRLGFADVRNHLTTPHLKMLMGTDIFVYHGYTELFLNDRWVKATPAFNRSLCERFNVKPLAFDGVNDSVFQAYDVLGNRHLEYVRDHGAYADVPLGDIVESFKQHYPHLVVESVLVNEGDFEHEAQPL